MTLQTNGIVPDGGIGSEIRHTSTAVQGIWKTEPLADFRCPPATNHPAEITWTPVILPLLERLAELRWLPENLKWPGADWPTDQAFLDAVSFTERLPVTIVATPHISLADDGEVNFSWSQDEMVIDLGFYGTGAFSFFARDKTGKEWFGDEIPVNSPLPVELRLLLSR